MKRLISYLRKIEHSIFSIQKVILLLIIFTLVLVNNAQVAGRYLFNFSLPWSEQLSVVLFIFIMVLGGNLAIKADDEIKIDLRFTDPEKQKTLSIVRDIISLAVLIILLCSSIFLILHSLKFRQIISSMQLPYSVVFIVMAVGFAIMIFDKFLVLAGRFDSAPGRGEEK
jgi:TRAP-type C4-dicarboxylate transport system permease small subunit